MHTNPLLGGSRLAALVAAASSSPPAPAPAPAPRAQLPPGLDAWEALQACRLSGAPDASAVTEHASAVPLRLPISCLSPVRILGDGAAGIVWLARWRGACPATQPPEVAVKQLQQASLLADGQAFRAVRELRCLARLRHPFIVPLLGADADEEHVYTVMPAVAGGTLATLMADPAAYGCEVGRGCGEGGAGLPESTVRFLVSCLVDALAYCHRRGVAVRDVKPENVLLRGGGGGSFARVAGVPPSDSGLGMRESHERGAGADLPPTAAFAGYPALCDLMFALGGCPGNGEPGMSGGGSLEGDSDADADGATEEEGVGGMAGQMHAANESAAAMNGEASWRGSSSAPDCKEGEEMRSRLAALYPSLPAHLASAAASLRQDVLRGALRPCCDAATPLRCGLDGGAALHHTSTFHDLRASAVHALLIMPTAREAIVRGGAIGRSCSAPTRGLRARSLLGTPSHTAPELHGSYARSISPLSEGAASDDTAASEGAYDPLAVDVWALGVIACELLTGQLPSTQQPEPVPGEAAAAMAQPFVHPITTLPPSLASASPAAAGFVAACLESDPRRRMSIWQATRSPWLAGVEWEALREGLLPAPLRWRGGEGSGHGDLEPPPPPPSFGRRTYFPASSAASTQQGDDKEGEDGGTGECRPSHLACPEGELHAPIFLEWQGRVQTS